MRQNVDGNLSSRFVASFRQSGSDESRGVARIFQGGGGGGSQKGTPSGDRDYNIIWFIPLLSLVYQRVQSYYRGMKAHIN